MSASRSQEESASRADGGSILAERLIKAAETAYENAYAPYSNYRVAAAVLADDGEIYTGCNIENAVYPLTICAERVAIFKAISAGATAIEALAVLTANGGTPCGSCRQVMREFAAGTMPIFVADTAGSYRTYTMDQLLPAGFSARDLSDANAEDRES